MSGLLQNPYKLNMMLQGLGLLTSKYEDQAERYQGNITGLLSNKTARDARAAETQKQRDYDDPYRQAQIDHMKAQTANLGGGASSKIQELGDGRKYWVQEGQEPKLVAPNLQLPDVGSQGVFKTPQDYLKAQQTTRKEANTALAPIRESIRKFGQATDMVEKRGGFASMSGADDTVLIKGFASMILPGEAVMSDDITTIVNQSGLPGAVESYLAAFRGQGQLGEEQRKAIYDTMTTLYSRAKTEHTGVKAMFQPDIDYGGFPESAIYRDFQYPTAYAPPGTTPAVKPVTGIETKVIDNVTYTKRGGDWYAE